MSDISKVNNPQISNLVSGFGRNILAKRKPSVPAAQIPTMTPTAWKLARTVSAAGPEEPAEQPGAPQLGS